MFKAAIKREQSQACLSYAEHEQARPQVNGQFSVGIQWIGRHFLLDTCRVSPLHL